MFAKVVDGYVALVVRVKCSKPFDEQIDLILGKVNRDILAFIFKVEAHLKLEKSMSMCGLILHIRYD